MSKYVDRAREYQSAIRKILMEEWDPIGVSDIPEAQDEYDSYIPHRRTNKTYAGRSTTPVSKQEGRKTCLNTFPKITYGH